MHPSSSPPRAATGRDRVAHRREHRGALLAVAQRSQAHTAHEHLPSRAHKGNASLHSTKPRQERITGSAFICRLIPWETFLLVFFAFCSCFSRLFFRICNCISFFLTEKYQMLILHLFFEK